MRGLKKRLGISLLCLLLVSTLIFPVCAVTDKCSDSCEHIAAIGSSHYITLEEAVAAAESGNTVTLLGDLTVCTPLLLHKQLSLDLGGNTLTTSVSDEAQAALQFTAGGSVKNGKIVAVEGIALQISGGKFSLAKDLQIKGAGSAPAVMITSVKDSETQVKLSCKLSGGGPAPLVEVSAQEGISHLNILKKARITAGKNPAIAFASAGKLDISGGTIKTTSDAILLTLVKGRKTEPSITGGTILSSKGEAIVIKAEKGVKIPKDFVTGGTFKKLPADYIPAYCQLQENTDGTYTVISSYTLTFRPGKGTGNMEPISVRCGSATQLPDCTFTAPAGKDFAGWKVCDTLYAPGDSFTPTADTVITAMWKSHKHTGGKATCLKQAVCEVCGEAYGGLGSHSLKYSGGYDATCENGGMNAHSKCSLCGGCFVDGVELSESSLFIPALGHDWKTFAEVPATCTDDGMLAYQECLTCGILHADGSAVTAEALIVPAAGHTLESVAAVQPTCTSSGIRAHSRCSVCQQLFADGKAVDADALTLSGASHVLSQWNTDADYHWKTCIDCGEVFRQNAHTDLDSDGACDDCGYSMSTPATQSSDAPSGLPLLLLIPVIAAAAVVVPLIIKKRKAM